MPTSLSLDQHLEALRSSGARLIDLAVDAGMDAPVPTCPAWDVAALVAHQAMVHRWATANVLGEDPDAVPTQSSVREHVADLPGYFREGHAALVAALRDAPPDLEAMTFLKDAPPPREFWARRQAHETTIHMVDALASVLGRLPTAAEVGIGPALAIDGLDELLVGFYTRGRLKLFDGTELTMAVVPADDGRRWILHIAERMTVDLVRGDVGAVDGTVTGTAAQLYLSLWNRADEVTVTGHPEVLARWRSTQQVKWS